MMSVFAGGVRRGWRLRLAALGGAAAGQTRRFWFWIAVAVAAAINVLFSFRRAGYTLLVNLVVVALVAFVAARDRQLMLVAASFVTVAVLAAAESDLAAAPACGDQRGGVVTRARHHHSDWPAY